MSVHESSDGESQYASTTGQKIHKTPRSKEGEVPNYEFEVSMTQNREIPGNGLHDCSWTLTKVPQNLLYTDTTGEDRRRYHLIMRSSVRSKIHSMEKRVSKLQHKNKKLEGELSFLTEGCTHIASLRDQQQSFIQHLIDSIRVHWPMYQPPTEGSAPSPSTGAPPPPPPSSVPQATSQQQQQQQQSYYYSSSNQQQQQQQQPTPVSSSLPVSIPSLPSATSNNNNSNNNNIWSPSSPSNLALPVSTPPSRPPTRAFVAVAPHDPMEAHEISLQPGDIVEVSRQDSSGWSWGRVIWSSASKSAVTNGVGGWFPQGALREI